MSNFKKILVYIYKIHRIPDNLPVDRIPNSYPIINESNKIFECQKYEDGW